MGQGNTNCPACGKKLALNGLYLHFRKALSGWDSIWDSRCLHTKWAKNNSVKIASEEYGYSFDDETLKRVIDEYKKKAEVNNKKRCLILVQSQEDAYKKFSEEYYRFSQEYLDLLATPSYEFLYFHRENGGKGFFFGYGKVEEPPFEDSKEKGYYFAHISNYKNFSNLVDLTDLTLQATDTIKALSTGKAIIKITEDDLDQICFKGGINLSFKADAHLIKVLGEQLIASEKVGILELIKNAYDAGASYCRVRIEGVGNLPPQEDLYEFKGYDYPVIIVEDDGIGMTTNDIENGWLRPASTIKTNIKERLKSEREYAIKTGNLGLYTNLIEQLKKEHGGRIPLGEKGVGRFATHRLGRKLEIKTKVKSEKYEYVLRIDWDEFDKISNTMVDLDSINVNLTRQIPSRDYGERGSGTQIIMYGGRQGFSWDSEKIEDINRSISRLNSPNPQKGKPLFKVFFECPQISDLIQYDYLKEFKSTFALDGLVDENGIFDYTLKFTPPRSVPMPKDTIEDRNFDLRPADKDYWKNKNNNNVFRKTECGTFLIHMDIWYRRKPWTEGPNAKDFLDYLYRFGGISLYRDGINIFPAEWGAENDWLYLSKRHIKQGFRISYYDFIGNIEINQTENLGLLDKTDREGLIDNQAFKDLSKLVKTIIENIVEKQWIAKRDKYNELTGDTTKNPKVLRAYTKQNVNIINNILENYPLQDDPYNILQGLGEKDKRQENIVNLQKKVKNLEDSLYLIEERQNLLIEQAGFGLAISVSLHEIVKIVADFYSGTMGVLRSKTPDLTKLSDLLTNAQFLGLELRRLRPLRTIRTEEATEFSIFKPIKLVKDIFKIKTDADNIKLIAEEHSDFKIFARYGAILQTLSNLIDNSCYWLDTSSIEQKIIKIIVNHIDRTVIVADNGPGLHVSILPYLFEPGYSLKNPPSGLGLYICKYYMRDMGGDIYVTGEGQRIEDMAGAQFTLDFSNVPSKKEQ
jgi:signal transduction histidine kinase